MDLVNPSGMTASPGGTSITRKAIRLLPRTAGGEHTPRPRLRLVQAPARRARHGRAGPAAYGNPVLE